MYSRGENTFSPPLTHLFHRKSSYKNAIGTSRLVMRNNVYCYTPISSPLVMMFTIKCSARINRLAIMTKVAIDWESYLLINVLHKFYFSAF